MKLSGNKTIELTKGAWSPEEDQKLFAQITQFGTRNWTQIPKAAGLSRSGKSCRLRWLNYLRPGLKRGNFTTEEIIIVMQSHELLGNKWSKIASFLPGRTDNEIKNFWHTYIRKSIKSDMPKNSKQKKKNIKIINPELSSADSSTTTIYSSIDFPIMESYSPNSDYSNSSVSNTENINLSEKDEDEDGLNNQNIFAETFSIEEEQLFLQQCLSLMNI
ncbi:hypothetical protein Leryth_027526 [Lithospermum erythrorhizon]|nr:hypothetical protein Leryth_027526 [Lithospermum erythrorhizon]